MNTRVQKALQQVLQSAGTVNATELQVFEEVFNLKQDFYTKVESLDDLVERFPQVAVLHEVLFDLLLVNFFAEDVLRLEGDYLESDEWAEIEDKTIDRGTELLNVLLYLNECSDQDIRPSVEDFLNEFLLVDDEDFQEECAIYEQMIAHQAQVNDTWENLQTKVLAVDDEKLGFLYAPTMLFFASVGTPKLYKSGASEQQAVYAMLQAYYKG